MEPERRLTDSCWNYQKNAMVVDGAGSLPKIPLWKFYSREIGKAMTTYSTEIKRLLAGIGYEPTIYQREPVRAKGKISAPTDEQRRCVDAVSSPERGWRMFRAEGYPL